MQLVIAEKPSVAQEIARVIGANVRQNGYLEGNGYYVTWCFGHLLELDIPEAEGEWILKNLPIVPKDYRLKPINLKLRAGMPDPLKVISSLLQKSTGIIVATDAGREGELIFRNIYSYLQCNKPFKRLWINDITEKSIREAFKNLPDGHQFDNVAAAAKVREVADWLVGINATRALTLKTSSDSVLSLGRVQTPMLRMICERYIERKTFVSHPYWYLQGESEKDDTCFRWRTINRYDTKEEVQKAFDSIHVTNLLTVTEVVTERKTKQPPLLFDIGSIQKIANTRYNYPISQTQAILQKLYEAALISYPRTDSRYISENVFVTVPGLLEKLESHPQYGQFAAALKNKQLNKRSVDDDKLTDHYALIPTGKTPAGLNQDEMNVYNLIVARFIEAFSSVSVSDITNVKFECGDVALETRGRLVIALGWRALSQNDAKDLELDKVDEIELSMCPLPQMAQGDLIPVSKMEIVEDQTKPKPMLTEATLLSAMMNAGKGEGKDVSSVLKDAKGIGTAATRAELLETLIKRQYVEKRDEGANKKRTYLWPTKLGFAVFKFVEDMSISNISLTARLEKSINDISEGIKTDKFYYKEITDYTASVTKDIVNTASQEKLDALKEKINESQMKCPKCGNTLRMSEKVLFCSNKECDFRIFRDILGKKLTLTQLKQVISTGESPVIKGLRSKEGKEFDGAFRLTENYNLELMFKQKETVKCPKCGKSLILGDKGVFCRDCDIAVFRTLSGVSLSDTTIKQLLEGKVTGKVTGFTSKNGKKFDAKLKLIDGRVKFQFDD